MRQLYGVTGGIGSGKSHLCKSLTEIGEIVGIDINHLNTDIIGRDIIGKDPKYQTVRDELNNAFGKSLLQSDGSIDKKIFSQYLTRSKEDLHKCNQILLPYSLKEIRNRIEEDRSDLLLVESALFAEHSFMDIVDYNMIMVFANDRIREDRVKERDCVYKNSMQRNKLQLSQQEKLERIIQAQQENGIGKLVVYDTSHNPKPKDYYKLIERLL